MIFPHVSYRRSFMLACGILLVNVAVLLAFVLVPALKFELPAGVHTNIHTLLETMSIIVSMLVFAIAWVTFTRERRSNVALLCTVFLGVAILDFVHTVSYDGMPWFLIPTKDGKSISFFLAARLLLAVALVAMAFQPWSRAIKSSERLWLLILSVGFALAVSVYALVEPAVMRWFFVPGSGLTPTKLAVGYATMSLNLVAAAGFYLRLREPQPYRVTTLFVAAGVMALSELCFTLYASFHDQYSLLGHVFKVEAYLLVFRAIFIEFLDGPYRQRDMARADLAESEEKYRLLFENAPDAYLIANADGSFHAANPAASALFRIAPQDLWRIGRNDVTSDPRLAAFLEERSRAGVARGELIMRRGDGSTFLAEVSSTTYTDSRDRTMGSTFVRDITEKRQAEKDILELNASLEQRVRERTAELEDAYLDLERFSHVMAHDLTSPLVSIDGFASLLKKSTTQPLDDKQIRYLDNISRSAGRMGEMISSLLELADVRRVPLDLQPLDLSAITREALATRAKREPDRAIEVSVQPDMMLKGDAKLLGRLMSHLIDSVYALTVRNPDAEIAVGSERLADGSLSYFVRSNGVGMNPELAERVLNSFGVPQGARDLSDGGITMAAVRSIVARHGGRVWGESTPDGGAVVRFSLGVAAA